MYMLLATAPPPGSDGTAPHGTVSNGTTGTGLEGPAVVLQPLDAAGAESGPARTVPLAHLPAAVREAEQDSPRWVWGQAQRWYPQLLRAGTSVERCHDLALCQNILVFSPFTQAGGYPRSHSYVPMDLGPEPEARDTGQDSLFDAPVVHSGPTPAELARELREQLESVKTSTEPRRLALLLAAESAGALVAAEMTRAGVPWREDLHRRILSDRLGAQPAEFARPERMEAIVEELRTLLGAPTLNPDSPQELMRALHRAGIDAKSTRSWELMEINHPAIGPLLAYKKLSRLFTANGWAWLEQWIHDGRFRPEYVVGGVVTGRWSSHGGGALQIPKQIRGAAHADPGFKLIVADAAQLEPRVLIALSQDAKMAEAARGKDLYAGIAAQGFGGERDKAKIALLGAMYGATTGESGRLMPQLTRTYPKAVGLVEAGARAGERGERVGTYLGRGTPPPSKEWLALQQTTSAEEQRRADSAARSRGRFTRNFVVQGSAAEWALCWLADLRRRLRTLAAAAPAGAPVPQMVFFLHDEVMVHCPEEQVAAVTDMMHQSAAAAARLIYGDIPIQFPVTAVAADTYAEAK
ncbi:bifunctional 3'-5' exonuclease/DNA polymerase [Arthrobacter sp. 35W]|uniref:bifunctional 3'-5' exonuclease/DNA polymerase n=1 Tax=Arthrobacter sp. 35W TaxID=1132441 RepID=UPI000412F9BC|nr:bifunctional 3'-5' exonuclease/DNA polymerase [Arthrobacter sp. 35W]